MNIIQIVDIVEATHALFKIKFRVCIFSEVSSAIFYVQLSLNHLLNLRLQVTYYIYIKSKFLFLYIYIFVG